MIYPFKLARKLAKLRVAFSENAQIWLNDDAVPILSHWYYKTKKDQRIDRHYAYVDNEWKLISKEMNCKGEINV